MSSIIDRLREGAMLVRELTGKPFWAQLGDGLFCIFALLVIFLDMLLLLGSR